jgi:type I restriction enzyme S subunit
MSKYPLETLHKKLDIKHGFPFKSEFFSDSGHYIVLTPGNFLEAGGFKRQAGKEKYYTSEIPNDYLHDKGDLIVAMTEQAEGLLGSCALVPEDDVYLHNQRLGLITENSNVMNKEFIYYLFQTKNVRRQIKLSSSGSKVKHTSPERIYDVVAPIPDIKIQENISSFLSDIDKKIELNNKINTELEAMAKLIYDYWFVQFDFPSDAPENKGKPYKSSGGKMVYNEKLKREIPDGWELKPLIEEMDVQYGYPFSTKLFNEDQEGSPVVRIRNVLDNSITMYSTEDADDKYQINKGDILVGMDGNFHINFWGKDGCYLNQRCVRIRKKKDSFISHFQAKFQIEPYVKAREKNVSRTTVGHLSAKDINELNVLVPCSKKVIQGMTTFDSLLEKVIINRNENSKLVELRDWLLPMLMNGQVTVKNTKEK